MVSLSKISLLHFDLGELLLELQELLGRKVDVVTEDSIYWLLKRRILKEAILLCAMILAPTAMNIN